MEKKCHYILKYFVLAFPLIYSLFALFAKNTELHYFNSVNNYFVEGLKITPLFDWYNDLLNLLGFGSVTKAAGSVFPLLLYYPIYIIYFYLIDVVVDLIVFVPKLFHKFMEKWSGN